MIEHRHITLVPALFLALSLISVQAFGDSSDDKAAEKVPVIILFKEKPNANDESFVKSNDGEIKQKYNIINGFAASIPEDKIEKIKKHPHVLSVDSDVEVHAIDLTADKQIRADQVWLNDVTGTGVPVAILDTGIDTSHKEFIGRVLKCHSELRSEVTCNDLNGHGSHVAGIVGAAGVDEKAKGVAPAVSFYIDKVLDRYGSGSLSGIIAGIDWVRSSTDAKIISMSLGTSPISTSQPNCDSTLPSLTAAVNNAVAAGISVVAAAGNSGSAGVGAPGCISSTIVVGAVDSTNKIPSFSSVGGPLTDHGVVAPGVRIYSTFPGGYGLASGTSMATPHVSGTIALMLKANPTLTPAEVKSNLFGSTCTQTTTPSCPTGTVPNKSYGHGRIDALAAYDAVSAPPPTADFSISSSPSTLSLVAGTSGSSKITITSIDGFNSLVSLSTSSFPGITTTLDAGITPPADGSATATLVISTTTSTPAGTYTYTITGTSGNLVHTTNLAVTITTPPVLNDAFSSGTNGWLYFGGTGYTLTNEAGAAKISGDGYVVEAGMEKTVSLANWDTSKPLILSFDWRAKSGYSGSSVTNAYVSIDGNVSPLVAGGTLDTGWKSYSKDITSIATGKNSIKIQLYLVDSWSANWNQVNWYDNIKLN